MPLTGRDFLRLTRFALVVTLAWLFIGFFYAWQHNTVILSRGEYDNLQDRVMAMGGAMFAWAIFTPIVFYLTDFIPVREPHRMRNLLLSGMLAVTVGFARAVVDGWLPPVISGVPSTFVDYRASLLALSHTHFLFAVLVIGVANFLRFEREESARRHGDARLESELAEARLRQLRADLHPHFLFNALNAVAALLHRDAPAAKEMLGKLRELLRASVASAETREVRLSEELDFLERYFDIQKMRFGEKLSTAIHVSDPELRDAAVPPLLLQPLVENSIIHGIGRRRDGGSVVVVVDREQSGDDQWLRLQVRDNGPGADQAAIFGRGNVGVPNAKARLESIYGRHQSLTYSRRGDAFIAEVRIPLRTVA
ncbi:MAG: two-component system, LytTR family, sensor kinase [Acidobacteriota bacterium]|jgi:signal transduction histidine kinase|nr:two-component system, LytTR family, sensor kinase [Acidobacteriota bacterium]